MNLKRCYLQPLRTGTDPSALTPPALKIGEVTSWLLRRTEDLNPRQQQLLADLRGYCSISCANASSITHRDSITEFAPEPFTLASDSLYVFQVCGSGSGVGQAHLKRPAVKPRSGP